MSLALLIAGFALRESLRRRVFLVVGLLTVAFLVLYGLGTWQAFKSARDFAGPTQSGVEPEVLAGATKTKVPEELRDVLPELMWLSQMGLVLYWIFDRTEGRQRSYRLAERGARLTARGVSLARFRVLRPLVREVHELFTDFLPGMTKVLPTPGKS